ncbi:hypothetical protein F4779DRAFT_627270 [Xylariaceae sp. FL0662B]|nr:hypothetical protein F4779DRAFT_627270 [Xylariaceae sp. FL0662B]
MDPTEVVDQPQESSDSDSDKEKNEGPKKLPRDRITGRPLAEDGVSCLRCIEKGLRCTLRFQGEVGQPRCAACKRSNSRYCLRLRAGPHDAFRGPPWKDPNFFSVGDNISREEMEALLKEHCLGPQKYLNGSYLYEAEREEMALPPFNGSDLPLENRHKNWKSMDWKHVLPTFRNQSLYPRSALLTPRESAPEGKRGDDSLQYLRISRRYPPRDEHLNGDLGETW